ncbi:hypothetical protein [Sphingomonas sp.]
MKKLTLAAALGATMLAGTAMATQTPAPQQAPGALQQRMAPPATRAEAIQRADAMFDRLDTNRDGIVTAAERQAAREARAERLEARGKAMGKRGERMMQRRDANRDGNISREEFRAAAVERFDRIDANRDGRIDETERAAAREQMKARWAERRAARAQQAQ